jgi:hypothetical protein
MDLDFMGNIGWRDAVIVIAGVTGIYLVLSVMRLLQVAAKRRAGVTGDTEQDPAPWRAGAINLEQVSEPAADPPAPEFARELARSNVEVELQSLRRECAALRDETARLGDEVSRLKATRNVSPLYNEAMVLAQQGVPPAGIAGHCGISIGEAELVAALARGETEFGHHQQGEDHHERNSDSGNRSNG